MNAADMLIACNVTGHVAVDTKVNTSRSVNKTADVWQHKTYLIGTIADSATGITDLAAAIHHLSTQVDATYLGTGLTSYSRFKPADGASESGFKIQTGDATTTAKIDSTHGSTFIGANTLSMPFADAINSLMQDKAADLSTANVLIMICIMAAAPLSPSTAPSAS